jgi:ABC-type polysaccharide/polyol phosphate export permease
MQFIYTLISNKVAILTLAKHNIRARYLETFGGILWSFLLPIASVFTYWAVFSLGFKATGPNEIPFVIYFITGYLPWSFFSECLIATTNSITSNKHLVKKMIFPTETIPVIEIISATYSHIILLLLSLMLIILHGISINIYFFQIIYAYLCLVSLVLGLGWILSSLNVFYRDISQIISVLLNFWFWATPVVWSIELIPNNYRWIMNFNPAYHILEAYRNSLIYNSSIFNNINSLILFWAICLSILLFGSYIFRSLKSDFADVI